MKTKPNQVFVSAGIHQAQPGGKGDEIRRTQEDPSVMEPDEAELTANTLFGSHCFMQVV